MKMGLLACTALSALMSMAQAAPPEPKSTSEPLRLTAPQMDTATAGGGIISVWIASAVTGLQSAHSRLNQFSRRLGQTDASIQLVVKINGLPAGGSFDSPKEIVIPSTGGAISIGETILVGRWR